MGTILYPSPIFGPVHSRRLGLSLGINLMPKDGKVCSFDCIYCECGFNSENRPTSQRPTREETFKTLEKKLQEMVAEGLPPDVITFAGNGEPTSHPKFSEIISDTIKLRDKYCPKARVSVLSNSTTAHKKDIHEALMKVDNNILKLDTVNPQYINMVNRPTSSYDVKKIIQALKAFNGHLIIQTMFLRGEFQGKNVDNTRDDYILEWLNALKEIRPEMVMIYTIDRETPALGLRKVEKKKLDEIRDKVISIGIKCTASY